MASKRFRDAVGIDPDRVVSAAVDAALGETHPRRKRHHPGRVLAAGAALAAAAAVGQRRMPRLAKAPLRMGLHKLGDMTHVDELADALRDRLAGHEDEPDGDYYDDEELDGEGFDEEFDDGPRDEAEDEPDDDDEDFDDEDEEGFDDEPEDGDGPRGEGDEADDEPDDDELEDEEPEDDFEPESDEEEPEEAEPETDEDEEDLEPEEDDEDQADEDDEQIAARSLDLGVRPGNDRRRARDRVPDLFEALRTPHRRAPVMRRGSLRVDPARRPPKHDESRPRDERRGRSNKPKPTAARA